MTPQYHLIRAAVIHGLRAGGMPFATGDAPGSGWTVVSAVDRDTIASIDAGMPDDLAWRWSIQRAILVGTPFGAPVVTRDVEWPPAPRRPTPPPTAADLAWATAWAGLNPHHRRSMELLAHVAERTP